jgi:protoheme ferro-lyase
MKQALYLCLILLLVCFNVHSSTLVRAPSLFRADEVDMHKYSAVLASTEPFRQQCIEKIQKASNPFVILISKITRKSLLEVGQQNRHCNEAIDNALNRFESRVQNTLRSYAMSNAEFNYLSNAISKQDIVRKKVLLQAYLYKVAADLETNLQQALPNLPSIAQRENRMLRSSSNGPSAAVDRDAPELRRFARALTEIESARISAREKLKSKLGLRELPPRMADPEYLPAMNPAVQQAATVFPSIAAAILNRHGLPVETFNSLQDKMKKNPLFRWSLKKELDRLEKTGRGIMRPRASSSVDEV